MKKGHIYLLSNPVYLKDIFKIGKTTKDPVMRANELSRHSGVPIPFQVIFSIECIDIKDAEDKIHDAFSNYRINDKREFFKIDPTFCVGVIIAIVNAINQGTELQVIKQ